MEHFNISKEELQRLEELIRKDDFLKDEKISKVQLIILHRLELWEKRYDELEKRFEEFEKHWMTPLIH